MTTMTSTNICNMALSYLARQRINDINEQSETARQCNLFYEQAKRELLREYTWGFAKRVAPLALLTTVRLAKPPTPEDAWEKNEDIAKILNDPDIPTKKTGRRIIKRDLKHWRAGHYGGVPDWKYLYVYPQKCIAARKIFSPETHHVLWCDKDIEEWDLFLATDNVQAIGCNIPKAWIEYTYDVDDVKLFSPDFVEALARLLAFKICVQVTGSANLQQTQYQLYQVALLKAKYTTAAEKKEKLDYPNKYFMGRG